ncbi:DUF5684 domain-containing protein [Microbacterium caowuchunii]|uniref:FHA domain-containing protein n=1 Tax=Microbacterium caowuchunii TaxID=2614638 RepID=A0A5N0TKT4_9MICO|nr:DUF5684 domain-containing protein [Microbacterium caowuchunii]KAA9133909.1 FHA domain-containing protein [Microbacterium caowuchunii]
MTDTFTGWNLLVVLLPTTLVGLAVYAWTALALGAVFGKLGIAGWKAWVPVYNAVVVLGLGGLSGWLLLLMLIPVFGPIFVFVALVTAAHRIGTAFGCGAGMTVLAALLFPVWASVLGFGAARPVEPLPLRAATRGGEEELSDFSARFERGHGGEDLLSARRSVPSPSAWIPPAASVAPVDAPPTAPVATIAPSWPEPYAPSPATADPFAVSEDAAASVPPHATEAPERAAFAEERMPEPAAAPPVMSWWQPAIVEEAEEPDQAQVLADIPDWARPVSSAPVDPPAETAPPAVLETVPPAVVPPLVSPDVSAPAAAPEPDAAPVETPDAHDAPSMFAPPPVLRGSFLAEPDAFPEASGEVSAVVGSPIAGPPRSAAASVSASRPGVGDFVEDTVIASRRRPKWALALPDGTTFDLSGDTAVLGRRPMPVHAAPGAQLVLVVDDTRTVSKTHALLRREAESWMVSDLGSTNGVVVVEDGAEVEVAPGAAHEVQETFLLGDAVLRLVPTDL